MTSSHPFRLELPAGPPFDGIAREVARRYAEVLGAPGGEGEAFAADVAKGVESIAQGSDAVVEMAFDSPPGAMEVRLLCAGRSSVVRRELAAGRS